MGKSTPLLKPSSTADRVASILRERIIATLEGTYIGSEAELAAEIGVSLPTLRQAARMLEYEQLLKIKPGKGGGYFSRRPTIKTAIQSASQYLSSKELISNLMWMDSADPVVISLLKSAVRCEDQALFDELKRFIDAQRDLVRDDALPDDSFRYSVELMTLLGKMSGNILLELFARILWNEVSISHPPSVDFEETQQLMRKNYKSRLAVAEAVYARDVDKAAKAWEKRSKLLRYWPQRGFNVGRNSNSG